MNLSDYSFLINMQVRDYELDYQGIVNNANYLHFSSPLATSFAARSASLSPRCTVRASTPSSPTSMPTI